MIAKIAWRNVWRGGKRSGILILAIAFAVWSGLMMIGLMSGMAAQQVTATVATRTSDIQIHADGFRARHDVTDTIPDAAAVLAALRARRDVTAFSARAIVTGMVSSATTARGAEIVGIDPAAERAVTDLSRHLVAGTYFTGSVRHPCLVGEDLARKLGVSLNHKIVVTAQAGDGSIGAGALRIVGIFRTSSLQYDQSTIFTLRADLAHAFALGDQVHEIAIDVTSGTDLDAVADQLRQRHPGLDVATWRELAPEVALTQDTTSQMNHIFLAVILVALVFGITNTMLMAVWDRLREFGVILALGMQRSWLFAMIVLETTLLSVIGGVIGIGLGAATVALLARTGLDLSPFGAGLAALGMDTRVYPHLALGEYPLVVALVVITAIAAAVYPGLKAGRLRPVRAIRTY